MVVVIEIFYTPTCPHCMEARNVVRKVAESVGKVVTIEEINSWSAEGQARANKYHVSSFPTVVVGGVRKITGVPSKERLRKAVERELSRQRCSPSSNQEAQTRNYSTCSKRHPNRFL